MNVKERTNFYVEQTGLSRAAVERFRKTPVSGWSTTADRKIGSTIRAVERMAKEPELSWADWLRSAARLLVVVGKYVKGAFEVVADFAGRLADAAVRVLAALRPVLESVAAIAHALGPVLERAHR